MLSANKEVFARAHIDKWQKAGYSGQGLRIAVLDMEGELYPYQQSSVTYPLGPFGKAEKHLGQCCAVLEQILPEAELFALPTSRAGWEWVLEQKPDLVSCSYCGPKLPEDIAAKLEQSGLVVCAAAGNSGTEDGADKLYPSAYPWTISVGAYSPNTGHVQQYSNGGTMLDCVAFAPIAVLNSNKKPIDFNGTSCATPFVAGMLGLAMAAAGNGKDLSWSREYIKLHSKDLLEPGKDQTSGYGLFCLPEPQAEVEEKMEIRMKIGSKTAYVDGKAVPLERAPEEQDGCTLVPVRFIAEALGCQVTYSGNVTREITIKG